MHISLEGGRPAIESLTVILRSHWPDLTNDFGPQSIKVGENHKGYTEVGIIAWNLHKVYGRQTLTIHADEPVVSIQPDGTAIALIRRMVLRYESKGHDTIHLKLDPIDLVDTERFTALIARLWETVKKQHSYKAEPAVA